MGERELEEGNQGEGEHREGNQGEGTRVGRSKQWCTSEKPAAANFR